MTTKKKTPRKPNPHHDDIPWGYVTVTKGLHKGQVFYYDDDTWDEYVYDRYEGRGNCAILCQGAFLDCYILVPHRYKLFRPSSAEEIADHLLHGNALWGSSDARIYREITITEINHGQFNKDVGATAKSDPPDIAIDTATAFRAVADARSDDHRRRQLLWLGVMVKTWIALIDSQFGAVDSQEEAAIRTKAIKTMRGR